MNSPVYLLDTDHLTLLERGGEACQTLRTKLSRVNTDRVSTTIISYEEQARGWLARVAQVRETEAQVRIYQKLEQNLRLFASMPIFNFDLAAATEFERLRRSYRRLGSMDLKIAAIAITQSAVVLTRNLSDFGQISELQAEDWSK
jgi:tRNA(fMet)-specific endonuclease VapC